MAEALRPDDRSVSQKDIVTSGLCIGCGACLALPQQPAGRMTWNRHGQLWPTPHSPGLGAAFARVCPFSPTAADEDALAAERYGQADRTDAGVGRYLAAYVGHVAEDSFRADGSSGGMTSWMAAELLGRGMVDGVAHVVAADPKRDGALFRYRIARTVEEARGGAKSRYYPIELSAVLREIAAREGRYAVIGVPCFIKAVNLLRRETPVFRDRIAFTLGLFCGHMKSARLVESFAEQMNAPIEEVSELDFRLKDARRPANWYRTRLTLSNGRSVERDWWNLLEGDWGSGFFQHGACNFCDDVMAETADVAFGDAWVEPFASDGRGANVVVVRSGAVRELVETAIADGRLELEPVDAAFVAKTQAAGLRQRREGLAYRLTWRRSGVRPRKRVAPSGRLPWRRKGIYRMRAVISAGSHPVFALARRLRWPGLYEIWGRACLGIYHGLAYSRGAWGKAFDALAALGLREPSDSSAA